MYKNNNFGKILSWRHVGPTLGSSAIFFLFVGATAQSSCRRALRSGKDVIHMYIKKAVGSRSNLRFSVRALRGLYGMFWGCSVVKRDMASFVFRLLLVCKDGLLLRTGVACRQHVGCGLPL